MMDLIKKQIKMEDHDMKGKKITEIADKIYFSSLGGRVDGTDVKKEYNLTDSEFNYAMSIIRNRNRRR